MDTIKIAGHKFTHKPYTRKTAQVFKERGAELDQAFENDEIDRFDYYYELLKIVADGPVDEVSPDDIEGREMEDFLMGFIPPSLRSYAALVGYSAL